MCKTSGQERNTEESEKKLKQLQTKGGEPNIKKTHTTNIQNVCIST